MKRQQHEYGTHRKFGHGGIKPGGHKYRSLSEKVATSGSTQIKQPDRFDHSTWYMGETDAFVLSIQRGGADPTIQ